MQILVGYKFHMYKKKWMKTNERELFKLGEQYILYNTNVRSKYKQFILGGWNN